MNDEFLKRMHKPPRREFADELYGRISKPMIKQRFSYDILPRRVVFAAVSFGLLLFVIFLFSPEVRAFADQQIRQIGALIFSKPDVDSTSPKFEASSALPTVPAPGDTNPPRTASLLADVSRLAGFDVLATRYLPEGYSVDSVWSIDRRDGDVYVVSTFRHNVKKQFLLLNQIQYGPGSSFEQTLGSNEQLSDINVRGTVGVWITGRLMTDPTDHATNLQTEPALHPTNWLVWNEGDITYALFGNGLSQLEMLRIAESLGG